MPNRLEQFVDHGEVHRIGFAASEGEYTDFGMIGNGDESHA
jgi:hypothetical protein